MQLLVDRWLVDSNRDFRYNMGTAEIPGGVHHGFGRKYQEAAGRTQAVPGICGGTAGRQQTGRIQMGNGSVRANRRQSGSAGGGVRDQPVPKLVSSSGTADIQSPSGEERAGEKPGNPTLRRAIWSGLRSPQQAAFLFTCTSMTTTSSSTLISPKRTSTVGR